MCQPCTDRLAGLLATVPDRGGVSGLATELDTATTRQVRFADRGRRTGLRTPIPFDVAAAEARDVLLDTLSAWTGETARRCGAPWPDRTLPAMAGWLGAELAWIRRQPDGGQAVDELTAALLNAIRAIDRPAGQRYAGRCPAPRPVPAGTRAAARTRDAAVTCGPASARNAAGAPDVAGTCGAPLYATADADTVTCRACGARHDVAGLLAQLLADADDKLLPATDAARAISALGPAIDGAKVRKWAQRGRLRARGTGRHHRPLYRLGDVRALAAASPGPAETASIGTPSTAPTEPTATDPAKTSPLKERQ